MTDAEKRGLSPIFAIFVPNAVACQERPLRAPRANRVFCTDEKHIRAENTLMVKSKGGLGRLFSKIADCARMRFSSARNQRFQRGRDAGRARGAAYNLFFGESNVPQSA